MVEASIVYCSAPLANLHIVMCDVCFSVVYFFPWMTKCCNSCVPFSKCIFSFDLFNVTHTHTRTHICACVIFETYTQTCSFRVVHARDSTIAWGVPPLASCGWGRGPGSWGSCLVINGYHWGLCLVPVEYWTSEPAGFTSPSCEECSSWADSTRQGYKSYKML